MEHLNSLNIECKKILSVWVFSLQVFFLSSEVGELTKTYKVWHNQMAKQNPSSSRPVSMITKGSACIHLTQMRKLLHESLKAEKAKGTVQQGESRQIRSVMAKDMDPRNKGNPKKKVQVGNTVVNEPRSAASGFSFKPELKISSAAVEAVKKAQRWQARREGDWIKDNAMDRNDVFKNTASTPDNMGNFLDPSLTSSHQVSCGPCGVLYRKDTPETMEKLSQQQGTDNHNPQKSSS
jgi:hypothetical protein